MATTSPQSRFWGPDLEHHITQRHGSAEQPLRDLKRFDSMDSVVFRVTLDGATYAFRPVGPGGQTRIAQHTYGAYVLNRALGLHTVPAAELCELWVHYKSVTSPWRGVLSNWAEGRRYNNREYQHHLIQDAAPGPLAAALTFEWWVNNTDVHHGNFYLTEEGRIVVIDHSLAFAPRDAPATFFLGHRPPEAIPASLLLRLHELDDLEAIASRHLPQPSVELLVQGRALLLERERERIEALLEAVSNAPDRDAGIARFEERELAELESAAQSGSEEAFQRLCRTLGHASPHRSTLESLAALNLRDAPSRLSEQTSLLVGEVEDSDLLLRIGLAAPRASIAKALGQRVGRLLVEKGINALEGLLEAHPGGHPAVLTAALEVGTEHLVDAGQYDAVPELLGRIAPTLVTPELRQALITRLIAMDALAQARLLLPEIQDEDEKERLEVRLVRRYGKREDRDALYEIAYEGETQGFSAEAIEEAHVVLRRMRR